MTIMRGLDARGSGAQGLAACAHIPVEHAHAPMQAAEDDDKPRALLDYAAAVAAGYRPPISPSLPPSLRCALCAALHLWGPAPQQLDG
jgi:hypothetical protein